MVTRREFLDTLAVGAAGLAVGTTAKSYGQILGANDRLNFAVIGLHGRAYAHLSALKANQNAARISHVCDVDSNTLQEIRRRNVQQGDGRSARSRARTSATFSSRKTWTPSPSPRPTTGTRQWPSPGCRPASTST